MAGRVVVGTDFQPIEEVETSLRKFGARYRRILFTDEELEFCGAGSAAASKLAARFAAKEATLKILDVGEHVPAWRSIEVKHRLGGQPEIVLRDGAARLAESQGIQILAVSFSHAGGVAVAVVVASLRSEQESDQ